jgi:molybdenum cofactor cytidylyltransferase
MKFQRVATEDAEGVIVAHAVRLPGLTLKKGEIVDARAVTELRRARVTEILVARLGLGTPTRTPRLGASPKKSRVLMFAWAPLSLVAAIPSQSAPASAS